MKTMTPIIPVSSHDCQLNSWKNTLKSAYKDVNQLLQAVGVKESALAYKVDSHAKFPVRVPQPYVDKMEYGNPKDPLLLQVLASSQENLDVVGYNKDPLKETELSEKSLLHKYHGRVLLILTSACAIHCRYCFRRHFPYQEKQAVGKKLAEAINYITKDSSISEVILSGGDPLMLSDESLEEIYLQLAQIKHLKRVRLHTRLPIVIPQRITSKLCNIIKQSPLKSSMVLHINHANEIDTPFELAIKKLSDINLPLFNQSVLLKNINDNADQLVALSEKLFAVNIIPYYLHLLDKVSGAAHFDISLETALQLSQTMRARLPGYLVPKLATEQAGEAAKTILS